MPNFEQSIEGADFGYLQIIAELWGIDFDALNVKEGVSLLSASIMDFDLIEEVVDTLPEKSKEALGEMMKGNGRMPWSLFTRRYGNVREMGTLQRDREQPYSIQNASPAEALWYRALVARSFFDSADGPMEYVYIPDDLMLVLPLPADEDVISLGRLASSLERKNLLHTSSKILDDACTVLAALRCGMHLENINKQLISSKFGPYKLRAEILEQLLHEAGLLDPDRLPVPKQVQRFLEADRGEALLWLINAWLGSKEFNELRLTPGLIFEGEWENNPVRTREAVLDFLEGLPLGSDVEFESSYWSVSAFIADIHERYPDFQRSAGDYDSWFIRDETSGANLRGYDHWIDVEGRLLNYFIGGILFWLGIVDIALSKKPENQSTITDANQSRYSQVTAFRYSSWGNALLNGFAPNIETPKNGEIIVQSNGRILVPLTVKLAIRYQIARFGSWHGLKDDHYHYHLTPASLRVAQSQGLRVAQLESLLHRNSIGIPPKLLQALKRWESEGVEARLERNVVLRVKNPEIITALQNSQSSRYLGEKLGPNSIIIKKAGIDKVKSTLANLGYLADDLVEL